MTKTKRIHLISHITYPLAQLAITTLSIIEGSCTNNAKLVIHHNHQSELKQFITIWHSIITSTINRNSIHLSINIHIPVIMITPQDTNRNTTTIPILLEWNMSKSYLCIRNFIVSHPYIHTHTHTHTPILHYHPDSSSMRHSMSMHKQQAPPSFVARPPKGSLACLSHVEDRTQEKKNQHLALTWQGHPRGHLRASHRAKGFPFGELLGGVREWRDNSKELVYMHPWFSIMKHSIPSTKACNSMYTT